LVLALWLVLTLTGCPLREKEIRITEGGASWIFRACAGSGGPGGGPGGGGPGGGGGFGGSGPPPPPGGGGPSSSSCSLDNHYPPNLYGRSNEARLFLVSPSDGRVQDASKCMRLHPCTDGGRFGDLDDCMANDLNQQLDGAMPNGLGFDGLKNAEEGQVVLALYQSPDSSEETGGCHRADLFACAGLAAPLGGGPYDITCASCQAGPRTAPGSNNGPCPRDQLSLGANCFLQVCDSLLANSGFD
jgi:hypothetical protein